MSRQGASARGAASGSASCSARDSALNSPAGGLSAPSSTGIVLLLGSVCLRATSTFSPLPGWDQDPFTVYDPASGFGPAGSFALDAATLLGAILLVWAPILSARGERDGPRNGTVGGAVTRWRVPGWGALALVLLSVCAFIGAICGHEGLRSIASSSPDVTWLVHNGRVAMQWFSSAFAGVCVAWAARDPQVRRVLLACVLGLIGALLVRALMQSLVEHPAMVADFRARQLEVLGSRGWSPDSPMARAYERRLLQNDASAWFALSNVLASFSACCAVACLGLLLAPFLIPDAHARSSVGAGNGQTRHGLTRSGPRTLLATAAGLIASLGALALTQSFGGFAALGVGITLIAAFKLLLWARGDGAACSRESGAAGTGIPGGLRRLAKRLLVPAFVLLAVSPVVLPVAAVIARGLAGDAVGELSLRYRWFYMQGAARILMEHPASGVGADQFQNAFLSAKPPLCPEDVTSPHSVVWDLLACLGLARGGLLVLALLGLLLLTAAGPLRVLRARIGGQKSGTPALAPSPDPGRSAAVNPSETKLVWLVAALATIVAAWTETGAMTPEMALARLAGLFAWALLARALLGGLRAIAEGPLSRRRIALALAPAAMALIAHAQIEVVGTWIGSAGLFWLVLGLAASACFSPSPPSSNPLPPPPPHSSPTPLRANTPAHRERQIGAVVTLILACAAPAWVGYLAWHVWNWEAHVRTAAREVQDVAVFSLRARAAHAPSERSDNESLQGLLKELDAALAAEQVAPGACAGEVNARGSTSADPLGQRLTALARARGARADADLSQSLQIAPGDWRTRRALSEVRLRLAAAAGACGDASDMRRQADLALKAVESAPHPPTGQANPPGAPREEPASLLRARLLVLETRAALFGGSGSGTGAQTADEPAVMIELRQAMGLIGPISRVDPHNPEVPFRGYSLARRLGDHEMALRWATEALRLQENCRLDPIARGLTPEQVRELEAVVRPRPAP